MSLFLPQTSSEPAKIKAFLALPFDCSYYDTIIFMYRRLRNSKLLRCLPHRGITVDDIACDRHRPLFNIFFHRVTPAIHFLQCMKKTEWLDHPGAWKTPYDYLKQLLTAK